MIDEQGVACLEVSHQYSEWLLSHQCHYQSLPFDLLHAGVQGGQGGAILNLTCSTLSIASSVLFILFSFLFPCLSSIGELEATYSGLLEVFHGLDQLIFSVCSHWILCLWDIYKFYTHMRLSGRPRHRTQGNCFPFYIILYVLSVPVLFSPLWGIVTRMLMRRISAFVSYPSFKLLRVA